MLTDRLLSISGEKNHIIPLSIKGAKVEMVDTFKFLGIDVSNDLTWDAHVNQCVRKAQQRLLFLRRLAGSGLSVDLLTKFYRAGRGKCTNSLHYCLVRKLHIRRTATVKPSRKNCRTDYRCQTTPAR